MSPTHLLVAIVSGSVLLSGCIDEPSEELVLENTQDEGKADSIAGKRINISVTDTRLVTSGGAGCSKTNDGPWVCGGNESGGSVQVFVTDTAISVRGTRVMPRDPEPFYLLQAKHEGFGLPNWRQVKYGQILYVRAGASENWTILRCPGMNYFGDRVLVDMVDGTVDDTTDNAGPISLASCGAPTGKIEIATFAFPVSRWFGLEDSYDYKLTVNKP
jgi:hypothetical protein